MSINISVPQSVCYSPMLKYKVRKTFYLPLKKFVAFDSKSFILLVPNAQKQNENEN